MSSTQTQFALPVTSNSISRIGRVFAAVAFIEAFTWSGLLLGMFLKYGPAETDLLVAIFGRLHGGAFLIYVAVTIVAAVKLRWTWRITLVAILAAIPPLVTVPLEIWLRRCGSLRSGIEKHAPVDAS